MNRTGLAAETARMITDTDGIKLVSREIGGAVITDVTVDDKARQRFGKPAGRYITIEGEPDGETIPALLRGALEQLLPKGGRLLAAGLGNPDITRDSLGALTVRELIARSGARFSLAAVETDVSVRTGIDTARMVRAIARETSADCVIAIDALACADPLRIGRTVQVSDTGIIPGAGACASRGELSAESVGVPVVAVGVPTVSELSSVTGREEHEGFLAAPADEDIIVKLWAQTIAEAVNYLTE